jgi:hypothetical protein
MSRTAAKVQIPVFTTSPLLNYVQKNRCAAAVVMVKLPKLPEQAIISGFKGTVDFYVYMGIPVARSWPRVSGKARAPAVAAQWPTFTYAAREWKKLSKTVQDAYMKMAQSSGLDGRDLQVRAYLSGLYRYETP